MSLDYDLEDLYDLEIKARYTYPDGITVIAFTRQDADYKHDKDLKEKKWE